MEQPAPLLETPFSATNTNQLNIKNLCVALSRLHRGFSLDPYTWLFCLLELDDETTDTGSDGFCTPVVVLNRGVVYVT